MQVARPITSWDAVPVIMDLPMASRLVGVTVENLKYLAGKGEFPAFKVGKLWRVDKDKLREWMDGRSSIKAAQSRTLAQA